MARDDGERDVAVARIRAGIDAVGAALIEVTRSVRADRYRYVLTHVDQMATDGEARSDHEVSKATVRAS